MSSAGLQETLVHYLQTARDSVLWKLDGVSEHDARRPLTPTGTNLLGLVKHLGYVELGYFVESFGREMPVASPFLRESLDGAAGLRAEGTNLPDGYDFAAYVARVQADADRFR